MILGGWKLSFDGLKEAPSLTAVEAENGVFSTSYISLMESSKMSIKQRDHVLSPKFQNGIKVIRIL